MTKIRLTGGEPTVRTDFLSVMEKIGTLRSRGLRELCLTTNGISLSRKLDRMVGAGLTGVNVSVDTLDPSLYQIMTRRQGLDAALKSIARVLEMKEHGADIKLKINCVVMKGINDREMIRFVEFGKERDLEVRFLEYLPFDGNKWSQGKLLPYNEMLQTIRREYPAIQKVPDGPNDTGKTYQIPGFRGKVAFVSGLTDNFCSTCNRLRITSDGNLKVCLFGNSEVSLRDIVRKLNGGMPINTEVLECLQRTSDSLCRGVGQAKSIEFEEVQHELLRIVSAAVKKKAAKHAGLGMVENMKNRPMILIGG